MNSSKMPKVSIVTASFNSAKTIENTILSIINQSYPNIEYIIIDGGSTDGTLDIIQKYQSHIAYWISEPDQGISDAWNKGLTHVTGEYVGFIGADDLYEPDVIQTVVIEFAKDDNLGFIFGNIYITDEAMDTKLVCLGDRDFEKNLLYDMTIPHLSVFIPKTVFDKYGGFDLDYRAAMDHEFILRLMSDGVKGKYINKFFGTMFLGGESNRNFIRCYREFARTSKKYGGNPIYIQLRLGNKIFKTFVRKCLEKMRVLWLVRRFRQLFSKRLRYLN